MLDNVYYTFQGNIYIDFVFSRRLRMNSYTLKRKVFTFANVFFSHEFNKFFIDYIYTKCDYVAQSEISQLMWFVMNTLDNDEDVNVSQRFRAKVIKLIKELLLSANRWLNVTIFEAGRTFNCWIWWNKDLIRSLFDHWNWCFSPWTMGSYQLKIT